MINVTFRYGATNSITKAFSAPVTIAQALQRDASIKAALGLPENVRPVSVDGTVLSMDYSLSNGAVIRFEQQAASKA